MKGDPLATTLDPIAKNTMASVHAMVTTAFATAL